jgi:small subunit ribosomal protein S3
VGQKIHPVGLRVGIIRDWESRWYSRDMAPLIKEDQRIRTSIKKKLSRAGISRIEIERYGSQTGGATKPLVRVTIHAARPGIIIGRGGTGIDALKKELEELTAKQIQLTVQEIRRPELEAQLVAENVAQQMERRVAYRRAMKQAVQRSLRAGAKGIRIAAAGRLGGAEIARYEWYREGRVPLHTLRADIDFGIGEALTTFGRIGVKVWIYRGDVLPEPRRTDLEMRRAHRHAPAPESVPARAGEPLVVPTRVEPVAVRRREEMRPVEPRGGPEAGGPPGGES